VKYSVKIHIKQFTFTSLRGTRPLAPPPPRAAGATAKLSHPGSDARSGANSCIDAAVRSPSTYSASPRAARAKNDAVDTLRSRGSSLQSPRRASGRAASPLRTQRSDERGHAFPAAQRVARFTSRSNGVAAMIDVSSHRAIQRAVRGEARSSSGWRCAAAEATRLGDQAVRKMSQLRSGGGGGVVAGLMVWWLIQQRNATAASTAQQMRMKESIVQNYEVLSECHWNDRTLFRTGGRVWCACRSRRVTPPDAMTVLLSAASPHSKVRMFKSLYKTTRTSSTRRKTQLEGLLQQGSSEDM